MATRRIRDEFKEIAGAASEPKTICPLDRDTFTHFLSSGQFSVGTAPCGSFNPFDRQGDFACDGSVAYNESGFRPAARSPKD